MKNNPIQRKIFFIGLSLIPFLIAALGIFTQLNTPYTGIKFKERDGKWFVAAVSPGSPAAAFPEIVGKEVSDIGEFSLGPYDLLPGYDYISDKNAYEHFWQAQKYFEENIEIGSPLVIALNSIVPNQQFSIQVTPAPISSLTQVIVKWLMPFIVVSASLFIGLIVVFKNLQDIRSILFFLLNLFASMVIISFYCITLRSPAFNINVLKFFGMINFSSLIFGSVIFLHFCVVFPAKKIANTKFFLVVTYTLAVILFLSYFSAWQFSAWKAEPVFSGIYCVAGMIAIIHSYFTISTAQEKYQVKWVLLGIGFFIFFHVAFIFYQLVSMPNVNEFIEDFVIIAFLFVPLSTSFAILKYRLMDIDSLFDNTLTYAGTLGILVVIDMGVVGLFSNKAFTNLFSFWIVIFAYLPIRNILKRGIKRLLKREVYDLNEITLKLCNRIILVPETAAVLKNTLEIINETLHPKGSEAFLAHEKIPSDSPEETIIAIPGSSGVLGYFSLKEKHSGRLYCSEDLRLLNVIAAQTGMAIENIRLKEERLKKEKEATKEKERISREIHDGIGTAFTNAIMLAEVVGNKEGNGKEMKNLQTLLNDGLKELRDLLWVVEEKENSLGETAAHIKEKTESLLEMEGVECEIFIELENENLVLPPVIKLNIVRIIQETLGNIIKHAKAKKVHLTIRERGGGVSVNIRDNGKGFDPYDIRSQGHGLRNMKKRCEEMGAEFVLRAGSEGGTEISVIIPFTKLCDPPSHI